jgi:hypothetical protein
MKTFMKPGAVASAALALAAATIATQAQASISDFLVYHSNSFTQNASGLSAPIASTEAVVTTSVNGEFTGGSVSAPDGSVNAVTDESSPGYPFGQFGAFMGPQPFGTFTANLSNSVTLETASATLSYTADHYPNLAPKVSNYAALQHFDPTKDNAIILTSGFISPADATDASETFFIFDEATDLRLLQYSLPAGATVFDVPANTASLGEHIGYYFESDIDYDTMVNGVLDVNVYRDITTGEINAATVVGVPEPATWAMLLLGVAGVGAVLRRRAAFAADLRA